MGGGRMMGTIKIITRENKKDNVTEFVFTYLDKTDVSELIRYIQDAIYEHNKLMEIAYKHQYTLKKLSEDD